MTTNDQELAGLESAIAIIGLAVRVPDASTIDQFWNNLSSGREAIRPLTPAELHQAGVSPELAAREDFVAAAATIEDVDMFDADFFGLSPMEARITDPQHRIFLECAWEALEDAGQVAADFPGRIGVYAGSGLNTYLLRNLLPAGRELTDTMGMLPLVIGNKSDFMVTQTSYALGLTGPSISVNTACSTSLVAAHFGVQGLLNYECDVALVGGVTIQVPQTGGYIYQSSGVFSPDGHCRPFDQHGKGTVPGNGAGVAVLKRLQDAIADGDRIYALIRATAINNDGRRKVGFTAPSVQGQQEVIAGAMALGAIPPESISYVETHGTATSLGDPLELRALADAYRAAGLAEGSCAIGSVKSNLGHLDAAAGIASLIKTALCLKNRKLVPTINFTAPNAACDFSATPFYVNTTLRDWDSGAGGTPRRAGVSSFGIGGTNAHAILEEWVEDEDAPAGEGGWTVLPVSARSEAALDSAVAKLTAHLDRHPEISAGAAAYTLQTGRTGFRHRRAFLRGPGEGALQAVTGPAASHRVAGIAEPSPRQIVFMFPGVGDQHPGMGRDLYRREPIFAEHFDACAEEWRARHGLDLHQVLAGGSADGRIDGAGPAAQTDPFAALRTGARQRPEAGKPDLSRATVAHAAIFATEYALARLLISWGLKPAALIGHSLGEYTAACIAGVMSLKDAIRLVAKRAELVEGLPEGAMLAVAAPGDQLQDRLPEGIDIAATNTAASCVLSGSVEGIAELERDLAKTGVAAWRVNSAHAFHSRMMDPIRAPLADLMATVELSPPAIPIVSNVTGDWITAEEATNPDYWVSHACQRVRFADGLATLRASAHYAYFEVGPGRGLTAFLLQDTPPEARDELCVGQFLASDLEAASDPYLTARSLAVAWCNGVGIDWKAVARGDRGRHVSLPTYPFERQSYWIDAPAAQAGSPPAVTVAAAAPATAPASGLDNAAAAEPSERSGAGAGALFAAPEGDVEELMAQLWMRVLGTNRVGRSDNFFHLGGSSLLALQLISHIRDAVQVEMPLRAVFDSPVLSDMSACLEHLLLSDIETEGDGDAAPEGGMAGPAAQQGTLMELPNGLKIVQFNQAETLHFYHDIFDTEVYGRNGIQIPADAVVFDVGANIGLFSLFVGQKASRATIYAFEPAPPLFAALVRNTQAHTGTMRLFNRGISAAQGSETLTFYPYSTGMSTFHADLDEEREVLRAIATNQHAQDDKAPSELLDHLDEILDSRFAATPYQCEISTLSQIIDDEGVERIDLLKIDVQKSELEVLEGLEDRHWPMVRQIVIEVHDLDGRVDRVRELITRKGFDVLVEQDPLYERTCIYNLYAVRSDPAAALESRLELSVDGGPR